MQLLKKYLAPLCHSKMRSMTVEQKKTTWANFTRYRARTRHFGNFLVEFFNWCTLGPKSWCSRLHIFTKNLSKRSSLDSLRILVICLGYTLAIDQKIKCDFIKFYFGKCLLLYWITFNERPTWMSKILENKKCINYESCQRIPWLNMR